MNKKMMVWALGTLVGRALAHVVSTWLERKWDQRHA